MPFCVGAHLRRGYPPPLLTLVEKYENSRHSTIFVSTIVIFFYYRSEVVVGLRWINWISSLQQNTLTFFIEKIWSSALDSNFISIWKHDFRCLLSFWGTQGDILPHILKMIVFFPLFEFSFFYFFRNGHMYPLLRWARTRFCPEMNELEPDKKNLKRGAPNFEKQKNESILKFRVIFFWKNLTFWAYMVTPEIRQRHVLSKKVQNRP